MRVLRLPIVHPHDFVSFTMESLSPCSVFTHRGSNSSTMLGRWSAGPPIRQLWEGTDWISHVPREPTRTFVLFLDPGRPHHQATKWLSVAPRWSDHGDPDEYIISGLNSSTPVPAVYASCRHYFRLRKTRFRLVANLYRVGVVTHRAPIENFNHGLIISLLSRLRGATDLLTSGILL